MKALHESIFFSDIKSSLAKKMLLAILLSSTIITFFIIIIQLFFEYKSDVKHIQERINQIETSYIKPLALSVWTYNEGQYKSQLEGILNIEDIVFTEIATLDERKIISSKGILPKDKMIKKEYILKTDLFGKEVIAGKLIVVASLQKVYEDLYNRALIILVTQGIKTFLISFIILYLFYQLVTKYLFQIAEYTKKINFDDDEKLILNKSNNGDEIDTIVEVINRMKEQERRYKKELEMLNKTLENRVQEKIESIRQYELKLSEQSKMIAMGDMISNIAHQWRQPLNIISIASSSIKIQKEQNNLNDDFLMKSVDNITKNTQYLSDIINTFSDFIKGDNQKEEVAICKLLDEGISLVQGTLKNKNINLYNKVHCEIDCGKRVYISKHQFTEVVINIVKNAIDILLERDIKNPWIKLDHTFENDYTIITIEDNGGGISEDILPKVFEPYFTTKHQSQGTGLGLHISYKIITESLGGRLYVINTENGAKFIIEIPLVKK